MPQLRLFNEMNVEKGLAKDEICPGTDLTDHAESLAMFDLRDSTVNNKVWKSAVQARTADIKEKLLRPYFGDEHLLTELSS